MKEEIRIEWIDYFKAITIIFMVVGHATGIFNKYIYQFHMASFFFISGYTFNYKKELVDIVKQKVCKLLIPFFTVFFAMLGTLKLLEKTRIYNYFFDAELPNGIMIIEEMLLNGNNYIMWLGASWFIITLFGIFILTKVVFIVSGNVVNYKNALMCIVIFLLGYYTVINHVSIKFLIFDFTLIFLGNFYFYCGIVSKDKGVIDWISKKKIIRIAILGISIFGMYYMGNRQGFTVDYPSKTFGNPMHNMIAGINGIIYIYILSTFLEKGPSFVKKVFKYIGENTLCIVFFHFMFFNIGYYILYKGGIVPLDYMKNFIPNHETSNYWMMYAVISITSSIILWNFFLKVPILKDLITGEIAIKKFTQKNEERRNYKKISATELKLYFISKYKQIKIIFNSNTIFFVSVAMVLLMIFILLSYPRVICNDELQLRLWALKGKDAFFQHCKVVQSANGRPLSIGIILNTYIDYIGIKLGINRVISTVILIVNAALFSKLVLKLINNKAVAMLCFILLLGAMPITFEHTIPNAFTSLVGIPTMTCLMSLIFYTKYIENGKNKYIVISLIAFIYSITSYEFFVVYIILYFMIGFKKIGEEKNIFTKSILSIKKMKYFVGVLAIYLIMYMCLRIIVPTTYAGNQIEFTAKGALEVVKNLAISSFPGYFIFNHKYRYLTDMALLKHSIELVDIICIIVITIFLICICRGIMLKRQVFASGRRTLLIIGAAIVVLILPAVPNSISKMYQGAVNSHDFITLPVSYVMSFSAVFIISNIVLLLLDRWKTKLVQVSIIVGMICIMVCVQGMNIIFMKEQIYDFDSLEEREMIFSTDAIRTLDNNMVVSESLFKQNHALAIHDAYWTEFANYKGLNMDIKRNRENGENNFINIYYKEPGCFIINDKKDYKVLLRYNAKNAEVFKINDIVIEIDEANKKEDNGFYVYDAEVVGKG